MGRTHNNFICTVEGCDNEATRKGLCQMHYSRFNNHGSTDKPPTKRTKVEMGKPLVNDSICIVEGCDKNAITKKLCSMHYQRFLRQGDVNEKTQKTCGLEECDKPYYGKGLCKMHYQRMKRVEKSR